MFRYLSTLLAFLILQPAVLPAQDDRWTPEDIIFTEYLSSPSFSPDGKMVVWTKRRAVKDKDKFVSDLYLTRLDLEKDGAFRTIQLTNQDENDSSPLFSRDGETIYFLSSRDEGKKLWSLSIYGGEPKEVHTFEDGISDLGWLNDSTLTFVSEEGKSLYQQQLKEKKDNTVVVEDSVHWDVKRVYTFNLKDKSTRRLTNNRYPVSGYQVSHDGGRLVYWLQMSPHYPADGKPDPTYYLLDTQSGEVREILQGLQTPRNFQFTAGDGGFYFVAITSSDPEWNGSGVGEIYYYDLARQAYDKVDLDWAWKTEGDYAVVGDDILVRLANGATTRLAYYRRDGGAWTKTAPALGDKNEHVDVMAVSEDGRRVAYVHSTASRLPRYYVADLNGGAFSGERELVKLNTRLAKKPTARAEIFRWTGYNGDEVNGILYYPENYQPGRRYPLMLSIHGGPSGVDLDQWSERWSTYPQILSQRGAFVLKPNYHGSSNHGQAFVESIKKNYYTPELTDIINGINELDRRGLIDTDSLGTMGWSNGAILSTMLTVRYPDMFRVACPGAGDVNWTSDFGTCQFGVTFDQSYFGGAPWDDTGDRSYNEVYLTYSPLFEMEKVKTPTIIFHGSADRAVPRDQGWEYYRALQQLDQAPVRFLWFPDQPHGLQKITHQLRKMNEELTWIDRYLFGKPDTTNVAFKEDSPLAGLLKREQAARRGGQFGVDHRGTLIPEVLPLAKDSIAVGRFEVTNAQFRAYDTKFSYPAGQDNYPARVSFAQAQGYVRWLSQRTGAAYRLPGKKEAEAWQKKAHEAGPKENTLNYWAGYEITLDEVPLLREKLIGMKSSLVREAGSFKPVKIGQAELYDLAGNLAEYAVDGSTYGYSAYDYVDPHSTVVRHAPEYTGFRVVRGK